MCGKRSVQNALHSVHDFHNSAVASGAACHAQGRTQVS